MKFFQALTLCLPLVLLRASAPLPPDGAPALAARYGSCPKGVIVEGEAVGLEKVRTIKYDIGQNAFILNQDARYAVPVPRDVLYQLVMALARDNRLGVSLTSAQKIVAYGALDANGAAARQLVEADKLLTGVVVGNFGYINGARLPEGVRPRQAPARRHAAICVHKFFGYVFTRRQNEYFRTQLKMANMLFPLSSRSAMDGGQLAADGADANLEPTDRENLGDLRAHSEEFLAVPEVRRAAEIGETAAFIRFLRDHGNLDLVKLGRHIMRK
ncbi:MAG: hypothetical protein J6333_08305 [Planctomycetes bacterium]|nr:hypothetical protein [Planctomycetota bacterium]